jgi:DNA-binding transcriptional LysR family regulator
VPAARWLDAHAVGATIALRSRELTDMVTAAVDGVGLAVLPCSLADVEPRLRRLTPQVLATSPLSLVHRREARLSPEVRLVIRFVVDVVKRNAARIHGLTPSA